MSWLVACWSVWPEGLGVEGPGSAAIAGAEAQAIWAVGDSGSFPSCRRPVCLEIDFEICIQEPVSSLPLCLSIGE